MKLATLDDGTRDGRLLVVRRDGLRSATEPGLPRTLQAALDDWDDCAARLRALAARLDDGSVDGEPLNAERLLAPLPRAYEWIDASAYLHHVRLARRARGAELPPGLETDPLVYQGGSGVLLAPRSPVPLPDASWGLDFEAEVCVIVGCVARGTSSAQAEGAIRLVTIGNDLTYRNLVPEEIAKGFGFFQSKPATAFAPFAVTPDELGSAYRDGRLHGTMQCELNGLSIGRANPGVGMHFSFFELVAHVAKTRSFCPGTILGSGTVSNEDAASGVSCLAEARAIETIETGAASTPFLAVGDRLRIEMKSAKGESLFGAIEQEVVET